MAANLAGLNPDFRQRLNALIAASHGQITVVSAFRSVAEQQALWSAALKKYGSAAAARKWVAPPGSSHHNMGIASDLGGNLALAHQLAPQFGLYFPMPWEAWHIEPIGSGANKNSMTTPPDWYQQQTAQDHAATKSAPAKWSMEDQLGALSSIITDPKSLADLSSSGAPSTNAMDSFAQGMDQVMNQPVPADVAPVEYSGDLPTGPDVPLGEVTPPPEPVRNYGKSKAI